MSGRPLELRVRDGFLDDYAALRDGCGAVRCERDVLRVHGPDALDYLQGQCSQDLEPLPVGGTADALLLEPQGKLDALVRLTKLSDDDLVIDVAPGYAESVHARLERFKLRIKAEIEALPWKMVAVRGKGVRGAGIESTDTGAGIGESLALAYSWNGVEGFDLLGVDPQVPDGARECGTDALDAVRIEAGIPEMGSELEERTIPAEAQLLERCVSFTKGCYTGQELVARLDARGNRVARHLRGLVVEADAGSHSGIVGSELILAGKAVGSVTSAAWSPALGAVAALGYVHRSLDPPAVVEISGLPSGSGDRSDPVTVQAEVRELPLV